MTTWEQEYESERKKKHKFCASDIVLVPLILDRKVPLILDQKNHPKSKIDNTIVLQFVSVIRSF